MGSIERGMTMSAVAYVVVVEQGKHGWTVGPWASRAKAESVEAELSNFAGITVWIEPVYDRNEVVRRLEAKDDS